MRSIARFVTFIILFAFTINASAQKTSSAMDAALSVLAPKKQELESRLEGRSRDILNNQLDSGNYLVLVSVQLNVKKIAQRLSALNSRTRLKALGRRMLPAELAEQFAAGLSPDEFLTYISSIQVNFKLDKKVDASLEKVLVGALGESLNLDTRRGDKIAVERVDFSNASTRKKYEDQLNGLKQELDRVREEKRTWELKGTGNETQKLQYETQLRGIQSDLEREREAHQKTKDLLEQQKKQAEDLQSQLGEMEEKTLFGKVRRAVKGIELLVTFLPIALIIIIVLTIFAVSFLSSQGKRSRSLLEGMQIIAGALGKGPTGAAARPSSQVNRETKESKKSDNETNAPLSDTNMEHARREAEESWQITQQEPYAALMLLKDWLQTPDGVSRFMAVSQALGTELARQLWEAFPQDDLASISNGNFELLPAAVGYQLVKQISTQAEAIKLSRPQWFRTADLSQLIKASDAQIAQLANDVSEDDLGPLLYSLSPARLARVLTLIPDSSRFIAAITRVPSRAEDECVSAIANATERLTAALESQSGNISNLVSTLYNFADASLKREISKLLESDEALAESLHGRIITIKDVLSVDKNTLSELLATFSENELAALVSSLTPQEGNVIASCLSQKFMVGVNQELSRIRSQPNLTRQAQILGERLQGVLVEEIRALIAEGRVVLADARKAG